jgi:hypothetical protein
MKFRLNTARLSTKFYCNQKLFTETGCVQPNRPEQNVKVFIYLFIIFILKMFFKFLIAIKFSTETGSVEPKLHVNKMQNFYLYHSNINFKYI